MYERKRLPTGQFAFALNDIATHIHNSAQVIDDIDYFKKLCAEYPKIMSLIQEIGCIPNSTFSETELDNIMNTNSDAYLEKSILNLLLSENGSEIINKYHNKSVLMQAILNVSRKFVDRLSN